MSGIRSAGKKASLLLTFDGKYGGDLYEDWLFDEMETRVPIKKATEKRRGGLRTLGSLGKLVLRGFCFGSGTLIRPFGMPVFRRNMIVVFHHYDHCGLPWYGRLVEWVDMLGLKLTHRFLNIRFLVVSCYWEQWLKARGFQVDFRIYNQIAGMNETSSSEVRLSLARKYGLRYDAKWVFLGGDQPKKGGRALLELWRLRGNEASGYQFIFSGRPSTTSSSDDELTVWIDDCDYANFISQLHVAVANSRFEEGWCRVAHEAILSNIPVTGSGRGGMAELLTMAGYAATSSEDQMIQFIKSPTLPSPDTSSRIANLISGNNEGELDRLASRLSNGEVLRDAF